MQDDSDCSSAEEERRRRHHHVSSTPAASSAAASCAPEKKLKKSHRGMASPPIPLSDSDLVQRQEMPFHLIPKITNMSELLSNCTHLERNPFDGSPICAEARAKILSGQTRKVVEKRKAPSASSSSHALSPAAAAMMHDDGGGDDAHDEKQRGMASPGTDDLTQALAAAAIAQQPDLNGHWVKDEFEKRLAALPRPVFYDPARLGAASISQEQLESELRRNRTRLPFQSALLESHLLTEAGTFIRPADPSAPEMHFPPCRNGDQCKGMTSLLRGQKRHCVFMMLMFQQEFKYLVRSGRPPGVARPCVLCARYAFTEAVVFARQMRMRGESQPGARSSVLPLSRSGHEVAQFYRNKCDIEGGYNKLHMLVTNHDPEDPVLEPVCLPSSSMLFCTESDVFVHKDSGKPRLVIDQSAIIWKAPVLLVPSIGQNLLSFCGGAGKN